MRQIRTRLKAGYFGAFRFARSRKAQSIASPDQNKNPSKSLRFRGRRFWKERIFVQPRQKRSQYCRIGEYFNKG